MYKLLYSHTLDYNTALKKEDALAMYNVDKSRK